MSGLPTIDALSELWAQGDSPDLPDFVGNAPISSLSLFELIAEDMRCALKAGKQRRAEYYLEQFDQLESTIQIDVVYYEYLLRSELGEDLPINEYETRFPKMANVIRRQLTLEKALNAGPGFSASTKETEEVPTTEATLKSLRDFQLQEEIGAGGMGKVFRAYHSWLHRDVAIKILSQKQFRDPDAVKRFEREMQAVGRVMHPNIVQAMDAGQENGRHFLALEFVDGIDAHKVSKNTGQLSVADACEIVRQAALGLEHAHDSKLIHRDIKPSNLLISKEGIVKVADMGLALLQQTNVRSDLTTSGQIVGTLDYIAPEQIEDMHDVDARCDIYGLGCTLYQFLTGKAPFANAGSVLKKLRAHEQTAPAPIGDQRFGDAVPDELCAIVEKTLAKQPDDRIQSAGELAELLLPFASGSDLPELVVNQHSIFGDAGSQSNSNRSTGATKHLPKGYRARRSKAGVKGKRWFVIAAASAVGIAAWLGGPIVKDFLGSKPKQASSSKPANQSRTPKRGGKIVHEPDPTSDRPLNTLNREELLAFLNWAESCGLNSTDTLLDESNQLRKSLNLIVDVDSEMAPQLIRRFMNANYRIFAIRLNGSQRPNSETLDAIREANVQALEAACPVSDDDLEKLPGTISRHLHLLHYVSVSNRTIETIAQKFRSLRILALPDATNISPDRFALLRDHQLISVTLREGVTDEHVREISRFPNLKTVVVTGDKLTDQSLEDLAANKSFQSVRIDTPKIGAAAYEQFIQKRPDCRAISRLYGNFIGPDFVPATGE